MTTDYERYTSIADEIIALRDSLPYSGSILKLTAKEAAQRAAREALTEKAHEYMLAAQDSLSIGDVTD